MIFIIKNELFQEIAAYIVNEVIDNSDSSMSGFQSIVNYSYVLEQFSMDIDIYTQDKIMEELIKREEVADVELNGDEFDVVIYTDYAKNYIDEE